MMKIKDISNKILHITTILASDNQNDNQEGNVKNAKNSEIENKKLQISTNSQKELLAAKNVLQKRLDKAIDQGNETEIKNIKNQIGQIDKNLLKFEQNNSNENIGMPISGDLNNIMQANAGNLLEGIMNFLNSKEFKESDLGKFIDDVANNKIPENEILSALAKAIVIPGLEIDAILEFSGNEIKSRQSMNLPMDGKLLSKYIKSFQMVCSVTQKNIMFIFYIITEKNSYQISLQDLTIFINNISKLSETERFSLLIEASKIEEILKGKESEIIDKLVQLFQKHGLKIKEGIKIKLLKN